MPTGNLPKEAKDIFERVYQEALKGQCDGDQGCAARIAWTAVKNAGWKKNKDGEWVKSKSLGLREFSLTIKKASKDRSGKMIWKADASDIDDDLQRDNMTIELFNNFIRRIQENDSPPPDFTSDFWKGGMPYLSISHYPDKNGKAVPGIATNIYVDGKFLKARGEFFDTPLGRACFDAICKDLSENTENPIRISIAFVDYKHRHKDSGLVFEKSEETPVCIECVRQSLGAMLGLIERSGVEYIDGHLIHLALTRVPANDRTRVEVEKAMITREEDALSIIGDDLYKEIFNEEEEEISKSLVIKSDVEEAAADVGQTDAPVIEEKSEAVDDTRNLILELSGKIDALDEKLNGLAEIMRSEAHPLDPFLTKIKSTFDALDGTVEERLKKIQAPYTELGERIKSLVEAEEREEDIISSEVQKAIQPLQQQLDLLLAKLENAGKTVEAKTSHVPERRSVTPKMVHEKAPVAKSKLRQIIETTT